MMGCSTLPPPDTTAAFAKGPWPKVPAIEMPTGDTSIPIRLLQGVADALLERPGARVCDPVTQRPIVGLSTEYCSTVYVAGDRDSLSWRVTEPVRGDHKSCSPFFVVKDDGYPSSQVLRYFPTGEIQQWSAAKASWLTLGRCTPGREGRSPQCDRPLRPLHE
jgi:hypothetical protein